MNTGDICPLNELVELRKKYKLRLILDESISFGTLGKHGRGLSEYLNVDVSPLNFSIKCHFHVSPFNLKRSEIDMICGTLEWGVGSIGGFCVGTTYITDHQVLSGLGELSCLVMCV